MNPRQKTLLAAGWAILEDYATVARQSGVKAVADVGELASRSAEAIKDVLYQHSSWVTIITEAYEGGVGKGQQARSLGREIENPWAEGMARTAWQRGYEVGKAQPENPLAEHWLKQYEWAFHGWEECKKVCDALRDDLVQCGGHQPVGSVVHPAPPPRYPSGAPAQVESNCIQCRNADSWGMPDQPVCKTCVAGSAWVPLNQDSVNPNKPHPDNVAVDRFAQAMKAKLAEAREKGRSGWETCPPEELSRMLREHVEKGDTRDVANFCAFLWSRRFTITPGPAPQAPNPELVDLCHAIVDLHKSNGCVLTVQIEQMAELLGEPNKGATE